MKLVPVEFVEGYTPYVKGDIAGFSKEEAARLIKIGVAKEYVPKKK